MASAELAVANTGAVMSGGGGALSLSPNQTNWTPEQLAVVKQLGLEGASEGELKLFLHVCQQTGLDPFARQIYGIMRKQYNFNTRQEEMKLTIQTGIDGFRLVAARPDRRTGAPSGYEGRVGPLWCGRDGIWTDVWTEDIHPYAAKVGVYKTGFREPLWATCHYSEYVQTKRDGSPTPMWASMPANQLAKCCEAAALRAAFPQDLSSVYAPEEMGHVAAQAMANRTVDAAPMRSDEEQAQWDAMATAEKSLDVPGLTALYKVAAKAKNDLLVAAISAAGIRVRRTLAAKAEQEVAANEPVEAEVVEATPAEPVEDPLAQLAEMESAQAEANDPYIGESAKTALALLFGRAGISSPEGRIRAVKESLGIEVSGLAELRVSQADELVKALGKMANARKAKAEEPQDVPLPADDAQ